MRCRAVEHIHHSRRATKCPSGKRVLWREALESRRCLSAITFVENEVAEIGAQLAAFTAADVDGDGDLDIVQSKGLNGGISVGWFENLSGKTLLTEQHVIEGRLPASNGFYHAIRTATDMDGDGDVDLVLNVDVGTQYELWWRENLDGKGDFAAQHFIATLEDIPHFIPRDMFPDLDGDGDRDFIISGLSEAGVSSKEIEIHWYEHVDGREGFAQHRIPTGWQTRPGTYDTVTFTTVDLDIDGDLDLVCVPWLFSKGDSAVWYENLNGKGQFRDAQILAANLSDGAEFINGADMDGDNDPDLVVTDSRSLKWYRNLGEGHLDEEPVTILDTTWLAGIREHTTDIDSDGDLDVVATFIDQDSVQTSAWFENVGGRGDFKSTHIIDLPAQSTFTNFRGAGDFDGDGDVDLFYSVRSQPLSPSLRLVRKPPHR